MSDKTESRWSANRPLSRQRLRLVSLVVAALLVAAYLMGCAAPAQPTPTAAKPAAPAPTAAKPAAPAPAAPTKAPAPAAAAPKAQPAAPAPKAAPTKVTMASTTGTIGLITEIVKQKKLDLANGIDLEVQSFNPAEAGMATAMKKVDVGIFAPIAAANAVNEGIPVRIFSSVIWNNNWLTVGKDTPYTKPQDLKGKKFATLAKNSGSYTTAQLIFAELGMNFEKDFQVITGAPVALATMLQKGDVDATWFADPWTIQLVETGKFRELAFANDMWKEIKGQPMMFIGLGTHKDWYAANQATAKKVMKVLQDGAKYINDNPQAVADASEFLGLKTPYQIEQAKKRFPKYFATTWDDSTLKDAQYQIKRAAELGIIDKMPSEEIFVIP